MNFEDELRGLFDDAAVEGPLEEGSLPLVKARARQRTVRARAATGVAVVAFGMLGGMAIASNWLGETVDEVDTIDDVQDPNVVEDSAGPELSDDDEANTTTVEITAGQLSPDDFTYMGAFRVPASANPEDGPARFDFGGFTSAFNPQGDPAGGDDFGGSLFLAGFPRNAEVAEISIPEPQLHNGDAGNLEVAEFLQPFADVTGGRAMTYVGSEEANGLEEYRIGGLEVVDGPGGTRLHWTAWQWLDNGDHDNPGHGHSSLDLSNPDPQGPFYLGDFEGYETAGYLFGVPDDFANGALGGRQLISGFAPISSENLSMSGGPPFFAFSPLAEAEPETRVEDPVALANYERPNFEVDGYSSEAVARGAAWLSTSDGRAAAVTFGNDIDLPGADCNAADELPLESYGPHVQFYDPADLAAVAAGDLDAHAIAPYGTLDLLPHLIPTCGAQIGGVSVDTETGRIYVVQAYADTVDSQFSLRPVIHVFEIG